MIARLRAFVNKNLKREESPDSIEHGNLGNGIRVTAS